MEPFNSESRSSSSLQPVVYAANVSSDVSLRGADDQSKPIQWIPCHRAVLAAQSTYFRSMFASQMKEAHEKQIQLKDIPHEILDQIVRYMYSSRISLEANYVLLLLESALFLEVIEIVGECQKFLKNIMNTGNWLTIQRTAEFLSCSDLINICDEFVVKNFSALSKCDDFLEINESKMVELIASDDLYAESEDEVADAVIRWLNSNPDQRLSHTGEILPLIRAPFLSAERYKLIRSIYMDPDQVSVEQFRKVTDDIIQHTPYQHRKSYKPILVGVGGEQRPKFVYRFEPSIEQWIPVRLLPQSPKSRSAYLPIVATLSGSVRIFDLIHGDGTARSCVWRFESDTDQWERLAPLPVGRCEGPLVVNEKVYVLVSGDESQSFLCYNEHSKEWDKCATVPKISLSSAMTVHDSGCIYMFGGHDVSYKVDKKGRLADSAYCFNPRDKTVKSLAKMPTKRYNSSAGVGPDGLIYVMGGIGAEHKRRFREFFVDCLEVYDPKTNEWEMKDVEKYDIPFSAARMFEFNGKLHCVGGCQSMAYYDAPRDRWMSVDGNLPHQLSGCSGYAAIPQHIVRKWTQQPGSCAHLKCSSGCSEDHW
ncbi:kelch-like protein 3 [Paramacrobiotus metropolitanus]|uniref:kelch-like protein 3 n=1 Tax=Paramacrobiotus metropolitanus TaxID=2943436 RepID=UPI002446270B|nr:kelch-like protein 3 [Paramacrobiotus metropolitanus]